MNARTILRSLAAATMLSAMPVGTINAVTATPTPAVTAATRLAALQTKGTAEIDRRVANLTSALAKLTASTKLTASDKATLVAEVNAQLSALAALKSKLAADTDLATARADVASIVVGYRVYALTLPKARMVASADRFAVAEEKLTALHDKLKAKVGTDATQLAKLTDMETRIAAAKTASDGIVPKLLALKPTDYNANHAVLVEYRASLKAAHDNLKQAREDAQEVIKALK